MYHTSFCHDCTIRNNDALCLIKKQNAWVWCSRLKIVYHIKFCNLRIVGYFQCNLLHITVEKMLTEERWRVLNVYHNSCLFTEAHNPPFRREDYLDCIVHVLDDCNTQLLVYPVKLCAPHYLKYIQLVK